MLQYFNNKTNGFFIEAGAHDGELLSNTLQLEASSTWTVQDKRNGPQNLSFYHDFSEFLATRVRGPNSAQRKAVRFYCNLSFHNHLSGDVAAGGNVSCQDWKCILSFHNQGGI